MMVLSLLIKGVQCMTVELQPPSMFSRIYGSDLFNFVALISVILTQLFAQRIHVHVDLLYFGCGQ